MTEIRSYRDLRVWQLGKELVKDVYAVTSLFPKDETYGLAQQLRRAAISIPSNIAEGHARANRRDYRQFLSFSLGSLAEVETQLEIACDLRYIDIEALHLLEQKADRLGKMLRRLVQSLARPQTQDPSPLPEATWSA